MNLTEANNYLLKAVVIKGAIYLVMKLYQFIRNSKWGNRNTNTNIPIPEEFYCPITHEIMRDPVITPSGICYERESIERWLRKNDDCPITKMPLRQNELKPCPAMRKAIQQLNHQ